MKLGRPDGSEDGFSMIVVLALGAIMTTLAVLLVNVSMGEVNRTGRAQRIASARDAAEAGIDDYVAKLTEDHRYYAHFVHPAESTRAHPGGATVRAGGVWDGTEVWTYQQANDAWRPLTNGYGYNLEMSAPTLLAPWVTIASTGRKTGAVREWRTLEVRVRPASIADFQMIANRDIAYGATATTRGKLYAGIDEFGVRHRISHQGSAYADLYAEGSITRHPTYYDGAAGYGSTTIRTKVKNPINFNAFTASLIEIQQVARNAGIVLDDPGVQGWRLAFDNTGNITVSRCTRVGAHLADQPPSCTLDSVRAVPSNGAIFAGQSIVVSGVVKGRVTIASNGDVVIGGDISYAVAGTDVLGLIARQEMIVARWVPYNLAWSAATIAQTGRWRSYVTDGSHGTMTFTGSTATNLGGFMNMFVTRNYLYDPNLTYLQPPYFPVLEEAYTVLFFRELTPG